MRFSYSQPYFIPFPGFFVRASLVDRFVLLDSVQFPRGFTWLRRNRLKGKDGTLWLSVPIKRKGMGFRPISEVEIFYGENWIRKHLLSIKHSYLHAPYFDEIFPEVERIYRRYHKKLLNFNFEFLHLIREKFYFRDNYLLQSNLGVEGKKEGLLLSLAEKLGAEEVLLNKEARSHLNLDFLIKEGLKIRFFEYRFPVYPQLWGDFIKDLSSLDILFNLGPAAARHIFKYQRPT